MATTTLTASVWGQGRQASALSAQAAKRMGKGDEECHICRDDVPATISFVPCKHKVCFGCVENMRAKNIFKADKGIRCPFCRQYVDGYQSLMAPNIQVQRFLAEANKAANIAAQARATAESRALQQQISASQQQLAVAPQAAQQQGHSSSSAAVARQGGGAASAVTGEDQIWTCGSCSTPNYLWRDFCSKCKKPTPRPYGTDKLSQTHKDIGSMSRFEILQLVQERGALGLRRALADAGITIDTQRSYGSTASVRDAVTMYGLRRRMLHIAEMLSDPMTLKDASCHHLGNFAVQRVLEAFSKVREAFPPSRPSADVQQFVNKHDGKDPFGALVAAMQPYMLDYCLHEKGGVYVVQTAANLCTNRELVSLGRAIAPLTLPAIRDPRGIFVVRTLLDLFSQRIWEDEDNREPALQCVDTICKQFMVTQQQLIATAMHALSGKVLVRAIAVAMPRFPALQLATKVACNANVLATLPGGLSTLTELLQLYGHNQLAMEGLRDVVTNMCYSLQGTMKTYALSRDEAAQEFLLCLIERLGLEQETGWLDSIAQELVGVANELYRHPAGLELLKFTLTQPVLDLDAVALHIADLKNVLDKPALVSVVADITERIAQNPGPPAPKYPAASVMQPELKYYLNKGWPTPLPPPPPLKPGTPGYQQTTTPQQLEANTDSSTPSASATVQQTAAGGGAISPVAASSSSSNDQHLAGASGNSSATGVGNSTVSDAGWGAEIGGSANAAGDPWATAVQMPEAENTHSSSSRKLLGQQVSTDHTAGVTANTAVAPAVSLPVNAISIPVAIPIPISAPAAAPAAYAAPSRPASANATLYQPPLQQRSRYSNTAVADFNTAAPARLNPGARPPPGVPEQQQQRSISTPLPTGPADSQQQQQQQQQLPPQQQVGSEPQQQQQHHESWSCIVCTYEHFGVEADFLFCAMCSSQRPDD